MNKNFDANLTVDDDTSDWTKEVYDEWDRRNSFSRAAHTKVEELKESGVLEDDIEIVRIDNKNDLEKQWEVWKSYDSIEGLDFYSYGHKEGAEVFAQNFANKQHVITYAQIDYTSFSHNPDVRHRIKDFDTTLGVYLYPYTWGYKEFRIEYNIMGSIIPYYQYYFNEWNYTGKGKRFEPCE